jgi:hypothetical protein
MTVDTNRGMSPAKARFVGLTNILQMLRPLSPATDMSWHTTRAAMGTTDLLVSERRAIASRNAGEGDVLDERLERNCHTRNIAFAVGGK